MDNCQATFQAVLGRARQVGFVGSDIMLAVDALEAAAVTKEQQASSERFRVEIDELRVVTRQHQELAERQIERQKTKIEQQSRQIQDLHDKNSQLMLGLPANA